MIRSLFSDAEAELAACNGDPSKSALHVIIIDEIDGIFRKRSSSEDSGEVTRGNSVEICIVQSLLLFMAFSHFCFILRFGLASAVNQVSDTH